MKTTYEIKTRSGQHLAVKYDFHCLYNHTTYDIIPLRWPIIGWS